jgi:hypothetical protein
MPQGKMNLRKRFKRFARNRRLRGAVFELGEDEATGGGLQRASHDDGPGFANVRAGVIDHDHRSVRQVTNSLVWLATFLDQMQIDFVTGDNRRPKSAGEIGQIQHRHSL